MYCTAGARPAAERPRVPSLRLRGPALQAPLSHGPIREEVQAYLKGHGNEPDFPRFLHKSVRHRSLTLHFELFRFWLRILGNVRIGKTTHRLNDTGSRRLSVSTIRGVGNSPTQRYRESTTLRITDTRSRRLPASPIRRVGY